MAWNLSFGEVEVFPGPCTGVRFVPALVRYNAHNDIVIAGAYIALGPGTIRFGWIKQFLLA